MTWRLDRLDAKVPGPGSTSGTAVQSPEASESAVLGPVSRRTKGFWD